MFCYLGDHFTPCNCCCGGGVVVSAFTCQSGPEFDFASGWIFLLDRRVVFKRNRDDWCWPSRLAVAWPRNVMTPALHTLRACRITQDIYVLKLRVLIVKRISFWSLSWYSFIISSCVLLLARPPYTEDIHACLSEMVDEIFFLKCTEKFSRGFLWHQYMPRFEPNYDKWWFFFSNLLSYANLWIVFFSPKNYCNLNRII